MDTFIPNASMVIGQMVQAHRQSLAEGFDRPESIELMAAANMAVAGREDLAQLLAVAVAELSEARPADAVPGRALLDEPAVAYADDDPNAPKAGA